MKSLFRILILSLLTSTAFAQALEIAKTDSSAASQSTRLRLTGNGTRMGQKGSTGNFQPFAFVSEVVAAAGSSVQQVNGKSPSGGNVSLTTSDIPEGTNQYFTNARGDARYPQLAGSYTNPTWLVSIPYSKVTSTPTTLSGYGITDAVNNTGAYANPAFITSLAASKITGLATVATSGAFNDLTGKPTTVSGYGITDAVTTTQIFPVTSVSTYSGLSGVSAPSAGYLKFVTVATDATYGETQNIYIVKPNGKIHKLATLPAEN